MSQLFEALGINASTLIANFVNFTIFALAIYAVGFKPMKKFIDERTALIEKGIEDAKKAESVLEDAKSEQERVTAEAHKQAQDIIEKAREQAKLQADDIVKKTEESVAQMAEKAKKDLNAERDRMVQETKDQALTLVIAATEKLLAEKVDTEKDKSQIERILQEVNV